jgi:plastocyanin
MYRRTACALAAALLGAAAIPAAALANSKAVFAGPPPSIVKIAPPLLPKNFTHTYNPDINAFFRTRTTIHVGETVSFKFRGAHTVDLPGTAGTPLPLIVPGSTLATGNDAAGNPFWFSGHVPAVGFNPAVLARSKATTYNGSARLESGFGQNKPFNIKFTKTGSFKFYCDVHPGMVGTIVVKPKSATIPTAKQDTAATNAQVTADVKAAKALPKTKLPANTVSLGEAGPGGLELFAMFPATLTVNAGTTVTFQMSKKSFETHTATFGPESYLAPLASSFRGAISPTAAFPSDPPVQPITLTPTSHGNGFANTGALDTDAASKQVPSSSQIDFTTPGTYRFECLIHPFMVGTVVVK